MFPNTEEEALMALRGEDLTLAATAEAMLWRTWCRSGHPEADRIFRSAVDAMQQRKLAEAELLFSQVIGLTPDFAEAWNKRATVRYLMQDYAASVDDCRETLARNPNHFGALSGQGLCHLALGQFAEAAGLFRRALAVHPHLSGARQNLQAAVSELVKWN